jgi:hypothetical protein
LNTILALNSGSDSVAAVAGMAVGIYRDVAELAGHSGHAVKDPAAQHDSSAHARAQSQDAHVIHVVRGSQPFFSQRGGVGIVLEDYRRLQPPLNLAVHRVVRPAGQVGRLPQHAGFHVDDARHPDANPGQREFASDLLPQALDRIGHLVNDEVAPARHLRSQRRLLQQVAGFVHRRDAQVGAPQVYSDRVICHFYS